MDTTTSRRTLFLNLFLFILIGIAIWMINIIAQNSFPGNRLVPFFIRSIILVVPVALAYYLNLKFIRKNILNDEILRFKPQLIQPCILGIILGFILIAALWTIVYFIYPFEIIRNTAPKVNLAKDTISYGFGNTIEELLTRCFLLLASIKLFRKTGGIVFVSLLFGVFHLQGMGLTAEGLRMVMTTFTMSLLFIAVIFYTKSIWPAVTLHITENVLLHTLGFDGEKNGLFQIGFSVTSVNGHIMTLIYEIVVIAFAVVIFLNARRKYKLPILWEAAVSS